MLVFIGMGLNCLKILCVLASRKNMTFVPTPVCVWPPFVFLVYNGSYDNEFINAFIVCIGIHLYFPWLW